MKLARYHAGGTVCIEEEAIPSCPPGGLLIRTEACGLCSGELMDWYLDRKAPHVLGHEVAGTVIESESPDFPTGSRVFAHHHAPCGICRHCKGGHPVHCAVWKRTKLLPGGMSEYFGVPSENLADTIRIDSLRSRDAALIEPLACVAKSIRRARITPQDSVAVLGLGVMGLLHMLILRDQATGYDIRESRNDWARERNLRVGEGAPAPGEYDVVIVCPGSANALDQAFEMIAPGGRILLFSPLPPAQLYQVDLDKQYFKDFELIASYSCGPEDTALSTKWLKEGKVVAEDVVSHFVKLTDLPAAYKEMKDMNILKVMVEFPPAD